MKRAIGILALLATACSSSAGSTGTDARTVVVGWPDKGHAVSLHEGDVLQVRLHSTYWRFGPASRNGVLSAGRRVVHAKPMPYPGSGAGTVVVTYHALRSGRVTISAGRIACGEAMRCTAGQGSYRLTVVVG